MVFLLLTRHSMQASSALVLLTLAPWTSTYGSSVIRLRSSSYASRKYSNKFDLTALATHTRQCRDAACSVSFVCRSRTLHAASLQCSRFIVSLENLSLNRNFDPQIDLNIWPIAQIAGCNVPLILMYTGDLSDSNVWEQNRRSKLLNGSNCRMWHYSIFDKH